MSDLRAVVLCKAEEAAGACRVACSGMVAWNVHPTQTMPQKLSPASGYGGINNSQSGFRGAGSWSARCAYGTRKGLRPLALIRWTVVFPTMPQARMGIAQDNALGQALHAHRHRQGNRRELPGNGQLPLIPAL